MKAISHISIIKFMVALNGIECSNNKVIEKKEFADLINKNRCKQQVPCMSGLDEFSLEER